MERLLRNMLVAAGLGLLAMHGAQAAGGLLLQDALVQAYQKNPDLDAARAALRGVDETYAQALAGFRPAVNGVADYTSSRISSSAGKQTSDPKTLSLQLTQSLYSGGSTLANTDQARNTVMATRARLKVTEQQVLLDAVTAYMNLIRDQEIVQLETSNENVLQSHLKASNERFKLGDITKTDVSQATSRLAKATASRVTAEGNLKKSRAFFQRVVGLPPEGLQKPALALTLPPSEDEALALALRENPAIILAKYTEDAARAGTRSVQGENLPRLDLTGTVSKLYDSTLTTAENANASAVEIRATLPLYAGGSTISRIRQARQVEYQRRMETQSAERTVRQSAIDAWEGLRAAEAEISALQAQIDAARLARDGVKVESQYGSRTTLDLLDAEQEYLDARVALVGAETDRTIAAYSLLAATGGLTAQALQLRVPYYDPAINFQNINTLRFLPKPGH